MHEGVVLPGFTSHRGVSNYLDSFRIQIARVDGSGVKIMDPFSLKTKWDFDGFRYNVNENKIKIPQ